MPARRLPLALALMLAAALGCSRSSSTPSAAPAPPAPDDAAQLQGKWKPVSAKGAGQEAPAEELGKVRFVIEGNKLSIRGEDRPDEAFSFTLDPTKLPKEIDLTALNKEGKPSILRTTSNDPGTKDVRKGIYSLEGDTLKICIADDHTTARPTDFEAPKGSELMVVTLRREK